MPTATIFDTEMAGLDSPGVIEVTWLALLSLSSLINGDNFIQQYTPSKPIGLAALATHPALNEKFAAGAPSDLSNLIKDIKYMTDHDVGFSRVTNDSPSVCRIFQAYAD